MTRKYRVTWLYGCTYNADNNTFTPASVRHEIVEANSYFAAREYGKSKVDPADLAGLQPPVHVQVLPLSHW